MVLQQPERERFIPACVGNARILSGQAVRRRVHPRVCGERGGPGIDRQSPTGSSPRVWGTPLLRRRFATVHRFIPACVGNAARTRLGTPRNAVHPRVCGERAKLPAAKYPDTGSSPRVWGTREQVDARADRSAVHPRVCGERASTSIAKTWGYGSSPRVWGTLARGRVCVRVLRFIPACVGNATHPAASSSRTPVHPRVCGERSVGSGVLGWLFGSSPRVWGTPPPPPDRRTTDRFIPACVGNAAWRLTPKRAPTVHPRVCGERGSAATARNCHAGSSPRVWGTRLCPPSPP